MKSKQIVSGVLILSIFAVANSFAQTDGKSLDKKQEFRRKKEMKIQKIHQQLGLSSEQQQRLEQNKVKYQDKTDDIYSQICDTRKELNAELQKNDLDMGKMSQLHDKIKILKSEKENLRFESLLEVREILSTQQFQEFMRLKEELKSNHKNKTLKQEKMIGFNKDTIIINDGVFFLFLNRLI